MSEDKVSGGTQRNGGGRRRLLLALAAAIVVVGLLAAASYAWNAWSASEAEDVPPSSEPAGESPAPENTAERAVGETLDTGTFVLRVTSAGPAVLPPEMPAPRAGNTRAAVRVAVVNQGSDPVPLNGTPYALDQTVLRIDGTEYPGALFSGAVANVREGTVPPNTELTLRFVFEVPEDSRDATFVWPPAAEDGGYPTLVVPIPDISAGTD